jgi:hypothetical protein
LLSFRPPFSGAARISRADGVARVPGCGSNALLAEAQKSGPGAAPAVDFNGACVGHFDLMKQSSSFAKR